MYVCYVAQIIDVCMAEAVHTDRRSYDRQFVTMRTEFPQTVRSIRQDAIFTFYILSYTIGKRKASSMGIEFHCIMNFKS